MRYDSFVRYTGDEKFSGFADTQVALEGVVVSDADERENAARFVFLADTVNYKQIKPTKIILSDNPYSQLQYGDRAVLEGRLETPENFEIDTGRIFDYISYLKKDRIFFIIKQPLVEIIARHKANPVTDVLFGIKKSFIKNLDAAIPFPESRLAAGLTVAGKKALPQSVQDDFQRSGAMQVVVLSGYNVTIIAETMALLLTRMPNIFGVSMGVAGIILFTIIAGGSATVVRGSIMAVLVLCAKLFGRKYDVGRALLITAVVMLLFNPMLLVFDPSFQLSFLATFGLIYFSPLCVRYFKWIPERFQLRNAVVATSATQVFVTPFILYQTGQISIVAVFANTLIFLFIPLTMLLAFISGVLYFVTQNFTMPISLLAYMFLKYELWVVHIFGQLPFALIQAKSFPVWLLGLAYACFGVLIWRFNNVKRARIKSQAT